ncbi:MAG: MATE family efflux transporter, partial [Oscillospiraceae bacterium]
MLFVKEKSFYKTLIAIALPIALQNLIAQGVSMMDTLMIGQLGDAQISGVASANQIFFILSLITFGLAGGASVLCSQYWGKKNTEAIRKIFGFSIKFSII